MQFVWQPRQSMLSVKKNLFFIFIFIFFFLGSKKAQRQSMLSVKKNLFFFFFFCSKKELDGLRGGGQRGGVEIHSACVAAADAAVQTSASTNLLKKILLPSTFRLFQEIANNYLAPCF